jgi:hypothetical protein
MAIETGCLKILLSIRSDLLILIKNKRNAIIISGSEGKNKFTSKSLKNAYKGIERGTRNTINNKKLSNRIKATNNASKNKGRNTMYGRPL